MRGLSKGCSVFMKRDTGKYTLNFKELPVSNRRELVNTMKVILDCLWSLLIRAPDHTLYIHVPPADNLSKTVWTQIR